MTNQKSKIDIDLDWIVLKALEKDPDRRYATAHALAEDIQRHLRHEPISAGAPGLLYRLRKYARRHRIGIAVGTCACILFLLGVVCVDLYKQNRARQDLLEQERQAHKVKQAQADLLAAETAFTNGQYQQALLQVDRSLEYLSDPLHAQLIKAHILWAQGKTDDALALLKQLEKEHPDEGSVYELLAYARFNPDNMWGRQTPLARPDEPGSRGIEILDIERDTVRRLVSFGHYPRWSPDGQYIAFVKTPYSFGEPWSEKTYIVPVAGGEPRHLCDQVLLSWSQDARYIYTFRAVDSSVYKWDITDPTEGPERIIYSHCYFPEISPDESRIAFQHRGYVVVQEISTGQTLTRWRLPILPGYKQASWHWGAPPNYEPIPLAWSPTGDELSIGSEWGHFGLWIYDLRTQTAARVLRGTALSGRWSADGSKMALVLGSPDWEIWQADIDPNRPSISSLGSCLTETEHCQQTLEELNDDVVLTYSELRPTVQGRVRAFCSAGLGLQEGAIDGLAQWRKSLAVLPGNVLADPRTYWDMTTPLLDWYAAKTGRPDDLLALAQDMARLVPQLWSGQVLTGMALYRAGAYEQALEKLRQADTLCKQSRDTLYPEHLAILAMTLHQAGQDEEAWETLESLRSLYLEPCSYDVLQSLVKAEKTFFESHESLCGLWEHVSAGHLNQALDLLQDLRRSSTEKDPKIMASLSSAGLQTALQFMERGKGYERRREYAQAMHHFESAALAAPWDAVFLKTLVRFQLFCPDVNLRNASRAIENATRACELGNWTRSDSLDTLASAYAATGRFTEAVRTQESVIENLPSDTSSSSRRHQALKLKLYKSGRAYHGQRLSGP